MKLGVYQFASTDNIENNLEIIYQAVKIAAFENVRVLVFHECALCGYPPIESSIENICELSINNALLRIAELAKQYQIYIAIGTVRFESSRRFNSIIIFDDKGLQAGHYDKKALWGWDVDHFVRGKEVGILEIDNTKIGFRICFDIRFPESFRELYKNEVELCFVCFSDTKETNDDLRYNLIKAHLVTRAVENVKTIVSINSISNYQTAPTAIFNHNGEVIKEAERYKEGLLVYDYRKPAISFGMQGRIENNKYFMK